MKLRFTFILFLLFFSTQFVFSVDEDSIKSAGKKRQWYVPDYIPIQYAGNIGFLSTGIGYSGPNDIYHFSLLYGYAPESLAGVSIHTLTAKNAFHIHRFNFNNDIVFIPYAGFGLSIEVGGRSFFTLPSNMPEKFYRFPRSFHMIPCAGVKLQYLSERMFCFRGMEFFAEATSADVYIWYTFISNEVKINQVVSVALGVNLMLK
jgi:hypothetical protein